MMCTNRLPNILAYLCFKRVLNGKNTPKYSTTQIIGFYPPFEHLTSKNGSIDVYLQGKREGQPTSTPPMHLQGKNSINITGLKDYYIDGKISGFAYGNPPDTPTFGIKSPKPNPFFEYKKDAFLFVIHKDDNEEVPNKIEMVVLKDCKLLASSYCKMLQMGGFDEELDELRKQESLYNNM